jgi:hypothetical protein
MANWRNQWKDFLIQRRHEKWEHLITSRLHPTPAILGSSTQEDRDFAHSLEESLGNLLVSSSEDKQMLVCI